MCGRIPILVLISLLTVSPPICHQSTTRSCLSLFLMPCCRCSVCILMYLSPGKVWACCLSWVLWAFPNSDNQTWPPRHVMSCSTAFDQFRVHLFYFQAPAIDIIDECRAWFTYIHIRVGGFKHCLFSISYMGCHPSHWLSYFSEGLKPPTSTSCFISEAEILLITGNAGDCGDLRVQLFGDQTNGWFRQPKG